MLARLSPEDKLVAGGKTHVPLALKPRPPGGASCFSSRTPLARFTTAKMARVEVTGSAPQRVTSSCMGTGAAGLTTGNTMAGSGSSLWMGLAHPLARPPL